MKTFLSLLLASLFLLQPLQASPKYYQYDGDVPFIEMMLEMMAAMGMIDRVPPNLTGYGSYMNPYMGNPFTNPQGFNAPGMMQGTSPNTMTGLPNLMGYGMSMNPYMGNPFTNPQSFNAPGMMQGIGPNAMTSLPNLMGYGMPMNPYMGNPFTNQPGFNAPDMMKGISPNTMPSPYDALTNKQTPCENEFCGDNKIALLNGLWITDYGEMLGIKNQQFLWSDGKSHYLTGQIHAQDNVFSLKVQGNGLVTSYQYRVDINHLQTRDSNGAVRSFIKEK